MALCGVRSGKCKTLSSNFFKSFHRFFAHTHDKRYVKLFLLLYYKKSIKEKVQFEKETIFDLSIEHYEELYIEMIVIPSLALLILVICIFYSNQSLCFQKGFRNKLEKLVFYIQE